MKTPLFLAMALCLAAPAAAEDGGEKTIYGRDSRRDFFEVGPAVQRSAMRSGVSLLRARALADEGDSFRVRSQPFGGPSRGMCPGERFFDQATAAFCSGTLIGPDLVLTAGHCMGPKNKPANRCADTRFVFGFSVEERGRLPVSVPKSGVYSCAGVPLYVHSAAGDYAVVKLDRPVAGRAPARVSLLEAPAAGDSIFTVGGPYGLPLKVTGSAEVRAVSGGFFRTNLDTSGGNSGGGIFDSGTGRLVGVHTASYDPDLAEVPLPEGHGLPADDPRVKSGKCKKQAAFGYDDGKGKKGYALSAIHGLSAVMLGARPDLVARDMPPPEHPGEAEGFEGFAAFR